MCRKKHLHGWCCLCFGLGLVVGHCLESWLACCGLGLGLMGLGFFLLGRR